MAYKVSDERLREYEAFYYRDLVEADQWEIAEDIKAMAAELLKFRKVA